jgi:hypothetical protein
VLVIEVGVVFVSWYTTECKGEEGKKEEEAEEEEQNKKGEESRRRKRLTTSSQRRTTNKPSDKPKHTEPRKIINQRSRYL